MRDEFRDILLSVGDLSIKVQELSTLVLDTVASDTGLDLIPQSLCVVGAELYRVGGATTLHRFLFDVVIAPALFDPHFLPDTRELGDSSIARRARHRMDRLAEYICIELLEFRGEVEANKQPPPQARMLARLASKLATKIVEDGSQSSDLGSTGQPRSGKVAQVCDLVAISNFELYTVHLSVSAFVRRSSGRALDPELLDVLEDLGEPQPLPHVYEENPFRVLRLPRPPLEEDHAPVGLGKETVNLLIRARSKVDSHHETWNPARDGRLLADLESCFEHAARSMEEFDRLEQSIRMMQRYWGQLEAKQRRLSAKLQSKPLYHESSHPQWSPGGSPFAGLASQVGNRSHFGGGASSQSSHVVLDSPQLASSPSTLDMSFVRQGAPSVSSQSSRLAPPTRRPPAPREESNNPDRGYAALGVSRPSLGHVAGQGSQVEDSSTLAELLSTVFSPLKL